MLLIPTSYRTVGPKDIIPDIGPKAHWAINVLNLSN